MAHEQSDTARKTTSASGQHGRSRMRFARVMLAALALCASFCVGFAVRGNTALLESLGFADTQAQSDRNPGATTSGDTRDSIGARVEEVEGLIQTKSLNSYDLESTTQSVLSAFAEATGDANFDYYDESRYALFLQEVSDTTTGIGVLFAERDGVAYAVDVFENSPASAAGVQQGDTVVAIDGDRSHDWTATEVTSHLMQAEGSSVVITWQRASVDNDAQNPTYTTTLNCASFSIKNVESELEDTVGLITVHQISQNTADLVKTAIDDLAAQGATSYVLDLRDNPGGYLTQAVDTASLFVNSGTIVKIETKESDETSRSASGVAETDAPLVVITNEDTAAAAEVLAAALQDNQRATLVGATTMGKGSVQVTYDLSFGGAVRYTAAYYKSPLGHDIDGVGVTPDVFVPASDEDDNQLQVAIETARSLTEG